MYSVVSSISSDQNVMTTSTPCFSSNNSTSSTIEPNRDPIFVSFFTLSVLMNAFTLSYCIAKKLARSSFFARTVRNNGNILEGIVVDRQNSDLVERRFAEEVNSPRRSDEASQAREEANSPRRSDEAPQTREEANSPRRSDEAPQTREEANSPRRSDEAPQTREEANSPRRSDEAPQTREEANSPRRSDEAPQNREEANSPRRSNEAHQVTEIRSQDHEGSLRRAIPLAGVSENGRSGGLI